MAPEAYMTKTERECVSVCQEVGLATLQIEYRGKHWAGVLISAEI